MSGALWWSVETIGAAAASIIIAQSGGQGSQDAAAAVPGAPVITNAITAMQANRIDH